jgi:subtilisin family serine protease
MRMSMMRMIWIAPLALLAVACGPVGISKTDTLDLVRNPEGTVAVNNSFVVQSKTITNEPAARSLSGQYNLEFGQFYASIQAFSVQGNQDNVLRLIAENKNSVEFAQQNYRVRYAATQTNAPAGLDRIDQRDLPLNTTYTYNDDGTGVNVYMLDSGILPSHSQFGNRAQTANPIPANLNDAIDCNGHGTQVAGLVGGSTYGVAKAARLIGVRIARSCSEDPTYADLVAGVDWVIRNRVAAEQAVLLFGVVASNSTNPLGTDPLERAVNAAISGNITVVAAAGNDNQNTSLNTPGRLAPVITVGAVDRNDSRSSFSNFGSALDLFAPGSQITSATIGGNDTTRDNLQGTSYAAAYAAGVTALYLQNNPAATPAQVQTALISTASVDKVGNPGADSPNRLLYSRRNLTASSEVSSTTGFGSLDTRWVKENAQDGFRGFQPQIAQMINDSYGWSSIDGVNAREEWYRLDFGGPQTVSRVDLYARDIDPFNTTVGTGFPQNFVIEVSNDATNWTAVRTLTDYPIPTVSLQSFALTPQQTRFLRVRATLLRNGNFQIREIEAY